MKITLLAEGHTKLDRFFNNWGISFLIGEDFLFDTFGKSSLLMKNIKKIGIDIQKIKHIFISHEHWDHTSGLWEILKQNKNVVVYICTKTPQKIKEKINSFGVKIQEIEEAIEIKKNIFSTGEVPSNYDSIYEQAVCIKTEKGLNFVTGCAHPGLVVFIKNMKEMFPNEKIYSVIGGFHLKDSNINEIEKVINDLKYFEIDNFIPLHCTGKKATKLFQKNFKCEKFVDNKFEI
jgi:7,8-dihydropterin-6-yl-methyl-4-(beta-D-ribofuranosyl)aminobenzene 5'-phosphate synthase